MASVHTKTHEQLLISVAEAAHRLSVSQRTAWKLARSGKLPTVRFGRRRLVPVSHLVVLIDSELAAQSGR